MDWVMAKKQRARKLAVCASVAWALLIGCGGGSDNDSLGSVGKGGCAGYSGTGGQGGADVLEQALARFADKFCAAAEACCVAVGKTKESCYNHQFKKFNLWKSTFESPLVVFDSQKWNKCIEAAVSAASSCDLEALDDLEHVCGMGTVPEGGACNESHECAKLKGTKISCEDHSCTSYVDHGSPGDTCGSTCYANLCLGVPGHPSGGARCHRDDGVYCDSDTFECTPLIAVGVGGCKGEMNPCADGGYCAQDECLPQKPLAQPCGNDEECLAGYCSAGLCVADKANGESCDSPEQCISGRCSNGSCGSLSTPSWAAQCG